MRRSQPRRPQTVVPGLVLLVGCLAGLLAVCAGAARAAAEESNAATTPADRLGEAWWAERHRASVAAAQAHPDARLLLIGDSITQNDEKNDPPDECFAPIWAQFYAPRGALNLGFSGDTTAHVLWRLAHGELDGLHPEAVLLLIGTNNTIAGQTSDATVAGIAAVVADLAWRLPAAHIVLVGLLPSDVSERKTRSDQVVNAELARRYRDDARVSFLDVGAVFRPSRQLDATLFYDPRLKQPGRPLHPDTRGQRLLAEAIEPHLARVLQHAQ